MCIPMLCCLTHSPTHSQEVTKQVHNVWFPPALCAELLAKDDAEVAQLEQQRQQQFAKTASATAAEHADAEHTYQPQQQSAADAVQEESALDVLDLSCSDHTSTVSLDSAAATASDDIATMHDTPHGQQQQQQQKQQMEAIATVCDTTTAASANGTAELSPAGTATDDDRSTAGRVRRPVRRYDASTTDDIDHSSPLAAPAAAARRARHADVAVRAPMLFGGHVALDNCIRACLAPSAAARPVA